MPKPGKYNKPTWRSQYDDVSSNNQRKAGFYEHDFRANNQRKVSFKTGRKEQGKDWGSMVRQHLLDEDVDMGVSTSNAKNINYKRNFHKRGGNAGSGGGGGGGGRSGSPGPQYIRRKLLESPSGWYRITLPHGSKYAKEFLHRALSQKVNPSNFCPIGWTTNGTIATFYVEDFKVADKLHNLDRSLQMPDGFRLIIKVHGGTPNMEVSAEMKEKMKLTMAKRYNAATKALDLTRFHTDPDLQEHFCTLFKPTVFSVVVDIISENLKDLEALSLEDNKLHTVFYPKKLTDCVPQLKILRLGKNKIRDWAVLDQLSAWPLVDLVLDGNPICSKFKEQSAYIGILLLRVFAEDNCCECSQKTFAASVRRIHPTSVLTTLLFFYSEVRKRFPKVIRLDGVDLEPPISFEIEENLSLPENHQTFLCNNAGGNIVRQFLEQYFQIFDTDNRELLRQAYHQQAMFSMTMAYPYGYQKDKNTSWLNFYSTDNRNLLKVEDLTRRQKLLKYGDLNIVAYLQDMPKTKHDIHSFSADLTFFSPQMLCLTVTGIFKEIKSGHKQPPLRYFHRTLVIVPSGTGFCIVNETLHITNCAEDQAKNAFKTPIPAVVVHPPTPVTSPNTSLTEAPQQAVQPNVTQVPQPIAAQPIVVPIPDQNTQMQMIQAMSDNSGMNLEWSKKCLEETQWNFERAAIVFAQAHKQGIIPAEAFVK